MISKRECKGVTEKNLQATTDGVERPRQAWEELARNLLKGELRRRGVTYKDLAERLKQVGVEESAPNISNKISRGSFTAVFLLQCLYVIGAKEIHLIE